MFSFGAHLSGTLNTVKSFTDLLPGTQPNHVLHVLQSMFYFIFFACFSGVVQEKVGSQQEKFSTMKSAEITLFIHLIP